MTELELSRRERKKEETKERIFQTAVKLFRDKGFEATTIDDITERADVAKGTFFNYFPRKEAVLGYLLEVRMTEAVENAEATLAERRPARDKLMALYADVCAGYEEDRELSWFILMESMKRAFAFSEDVFSRWYNLTVGVIQQGQASGELRANVDPTRAERVLHSTFLGTLFMWLKCPEAGDLNLQAELEERMTLVLDGLAAKA
ncbi:MAG: TetR/AcrR family transcriptional regulator [Gemmatimonadetes bacterium]|nr:TetR/AcrR family transcriptional regulator [Gemmatimonadota bacterium]MBI2401423.1 TetR/AcrR family transcriptional regulator [Gemmatimonadota bacterium]MBI2535925.1 TetR/AcrR family transcriptional regulator [Gemmatimonadota bacterium]MBI2615374.1 TetR/AcrR family transcriptional regulator [Gemmatimonadota bacterium]